MAYKRPPITEAVIELRFAHPAGQRDVEKAAKRLRGEYFYSDPEANSSVSFDMTTQKADVKTEWTGIKLSSLDRTDVLSFRTASFFCSRLAPYSDWESFRDRAIRGWEVWRSTVGSPPELARIGVRYINRIDIPVEGSAGQIETKRYLRLSPELPSELNEPMLNYAMQVVLPLGTGDCRLTLGSGTVPSPLIGHVSLVLDLDVFRETDLPRRDDELWTLLNDMRGHKNRVFESCITDSAKALFDQ
jgi:uncharacterized protein (TIGR04255 family)